MLFHTTTTPPALDAKVTVKFAGLLLLKPAGNRCEVGIIHRLSNTHAFQVMLIVSRPDRPPNLTRLLAGPLTTPLDISVQPEPRTGVEAFVSSAGPLDRRQAPEPPRPGRPTQATPDTNYEHDFRWALNVQELHKNKNVDFNEGARPIAMLNTGTLYTPTLTRLELTPVLVREQETKQLHRFSADLGAAIDLPAEGGTVTLSWEHQEEPRSYTLPRSFDPPDVRYTIVLLNDPPISGTAPHDEFAHYYNVLESNGQPIPDEEQFHIVYRGEPTTDEIPCMPVVINPPTS